jgi:hypothetical protein
VRGLLPPHLDFLPFLFGLGAFARGGPEWFIAMGFVLALSRQVQ